MKTKKSKKFFALTEKQKRKDRTVNRDLPPASYRKVFNDSFDAKCKQTLIRILKGEEVEFPVFVKDIGWYYW